MTHKLRMLLMGGFLGLSLLGSAFCLPTGTYAQTTAVTIRSEEEPQEQESQDAGSYGKTGGLGVAPVVVGLACSALGFSALAVRYRLRDDE